MRLVQENSANISVFPNHPKRPEGYNAYTNWSDFPQKIINLESPGLNKQFLCSIEWSEKYKDEWTENYYFSSDRNQFYLWSNIPEFNCPPEVDDNHLVSFGDFWEIIAYCKRIPADEKDIAILLLSDFWRERFNETGYRKIYKISASSYISRAEIKIIENQLLREFLPG